MLSAKKLKEFQTLILAGIPEFKVSETVVSDNDVAEFTRDIKSIDNEFVLIGVLPSFGLDFADVDNYLHNNKLMLFVVKKFNVKSSYDEFLEVFDDTGAMVLKLEQWLFSESRKFKCNPIFKKIDFRTFKADPVRDYHGFAGYMINANLKTK